MAVIGHKQVEKTDDGFGEIFRLLIAIYYNCQRPLRGLPQEHGVKRFGSRGKAGQAGVAASVYAAQQLLESRMASQIQK